MNWGKGITLAIVAFMGFILFMVVKATQTSTDLYAEDYYAQEVNFQETIDARNNANLLSTSLEFTLTPQTVNISFPSEVNGQDVDGFVLFYRPENASFDRKFPIRIQGNTMSIDRQQLVVGNYQAKVFFTMNGKRYQIEQPIHIPPSKS